MFGSVTRGEDGPDSDVDLLVGLPAAIGLFGIARVQEQLQEIMDAPVELIPVSDLEPGVWNVLAELVPL